MIQLLVPKSPYHKSWRDQIYICMIGKIKIKMEAYHEPEHCTLHTKAEFLFSNIGPICTFRGDLYKSQKLIPIIMPWCWMVISELCLQLWCHNVISEFSWFLIYQLRKMGSCSVITVNIIFHHFATVNFCKFLKLQTTMKL